MHQFANSSNPSYWQAGENERGHHRMTDIAAEDVRADLMVTIGILAAFDDPEVESIGLSQKAIIQARESVWAAIHYLDEQAELHDD